MACTCIDAPYSSTNPKLALLTPQPHFVPGYTGYVPQAKFRPGKTFGITSHRALIDPCIHMSPRPVLTNIHPGNCTDEYGRPMPHSNSLEAQVAIVQNRIQSFGRQQYKAHMMPGYSGYVPRLQTILGHSFSPACNRALASFEQEQWRDRLFKRELEALDGWRMCYKKKPWELPEWNRDPYAEYNQFLRSCINANRENGQSKCIRKEAVGCADAGIGSCNCVTCR